MSLSEVLPGAFPPDPPPNRRRGTARALRKRKKRRRRRAIFVIFMTVVLVGGGIAGAYLGLAPLIRQLNEPKDYVGSGTGKVQVKIPPGASGRTIARVLESAGVVKTQVAYLDVVKSDIRANGVQPGTYDLKLKMSGAAALKALLDPTTRILRTVTIPEGTRLTDALTLIAKQLEIKRADLKKATKSKSLGLPKAAKGNLEGFLFPATYDFQPDDTATDVLTKMVERGKQAFDKLDIPESKLRSVVIEASIVQAEAGSKKYMGKVATVLNNRQKQHIKLQLDSTVSYATGKFNVTTTKADRAVNNPYNTYRFAGLPAGPISNPGEEALAAVMKPTPGPWLFFVTTNPSTGETKFAVDAAGHQANVREFQAWLRAHPS